MAKAQFESSRKFNWRTTIDLLQVQLKVNVEILPIEFVSKHCGEKKFVIWQKVFDGKF